MAGVLLKLQSSIVAAYRVFLDKSLSLCALNGTVFIVHDDCADSGLDQKILIQILFQKKVQQCIHMLNRL